MDRDPEVTKYVPRPWSDPAGHEAFVRGRIEADYGPGLGYWSVFAHDRPEHFLGWILLIPCDGIGPEIEIGWRFLRETWGKGYATEAARPVLAHAMDTLALDRVVAEIHPDNDGSVRVALKLGMSDEGLIDKAGTPWRFFVMR